MPAGRPLKYEAPEDIALLPDGEVVYSGSKLRFNHFATESELTQFLSENIKEFTASHLGGKYVRHCIDMPIVKQDRFSPRGKRVDIYVETTEGDYLIELKCPRYIAENRRGIGQLLDYGREFKDKSPNLLLVTTNFDIDTARTIEYYNLPIRYLVAGKNQILEYLGESNG